MTASANMQQIPPSSHHASLQFELTLVVLGAIAVTHSQQQWVWVHVLEQHGFSIEFPAERQFWLNKSDPASLSSWCFTVIRQVPLGFFGTGHFFLISLTIFQPEQTKFRDGKPRRVDSWAQLSDDVRSLHDDLSAFHRWWDNITQTSAVSSLS